MLHEEITERVIGAAYEVHRVLGNGFAEKVYENALAIELRKAGLRVMQQEAIKIQYKGELVGRYVADLIVDDPVILKLKAMRELCPEHEAQTLNYLRATDIEVGLLFNFSLKLEFKRLLFTNDRKNK